MPELSINDNDFEQVWFKLEKPGWKQLVVAVGCRPLSGKIDYFITSFKQSITTTHVVTPQILYYWGISIHVGYSKTRHPSRQISKKCIDDVGRIQIIKSPTRITNNCKSVIDLIFTNIADNTIGGNGVIDIPISNHLPLEHSLP